MSDQRTRLIWQDEIIHLNHLLFRKIYEKWWTSVYALAFSYLKNEEICRDLVQDVFLGLWNRNPALQPIQSIEAYLVKSAKTALVKAAKNQHNSADRLDAGECRNILYDPGFESRLCSEELEHEIKKIVQGFPEPRKTIFLMSVEDELSNVEIAQNLTLSEKTISFHLVKARKEIKEFVKQLF